MIYLGIVIQVCIDILEESAMRVLKVEIYISDQKESQADLFDGFATLTSTSQCRS